MGNMVFMVPLVACSLCVSLVFSVWVYVDCWVRREKGASFMSFVFRLHNSVTSTWAAKTTNYRTILAMLHLWIFTIFLRTIEANKKNSSMHLIISRLWCAVCVYACDDHQCQKRQTFSQIKWCKCGNTIVYAMCMCMCMIQCCVRACSYACVVNAHSYTTKWCVFAWYCE